MATAVMALPIQISVQRPLVASEALAMGASAAADSRPVDDDDELAGGGGVACGISQDSAAAVVGASPVSPALAMWK